MTIEMISAFWLGGFAAMSEMQILAALRLGRFESSLVPVLWPMAVAIAIVAAYRRRPR